jgi:signal transduction histidine kinase
MRLTLLYGGLFLLSGAALMAISYALLVNAGFVFSLQSGPATAPPTQLPSSTQPRSALPFPATGAPTHPSAQTMAYWRNVAQCMRQHGVSGFPEPRSSVPSDLRHLERLGTHDGGLGVLSDRNGAILLIPDTINMQSAVFTQAASACGYMADSSQQIAQENRRRAQVRQELVIQSGIALAGMSLLSLGVGWLMAGRVLQPLEDSYQAQRQFVANASHELRAPLTRQRALIQVALADPEASVPSLRAAHERVLASEQHLEQMIDALLTLTRGQAGLERREPLDLAALASQAMLAREPELATLNLEIRSRLKSAPTHGDPRLVERLIANLIDNAIRHNNPGGSVEITTGTRDRHAFLSISNTGQTIPPEQIQRLFQPFERLGGARSRHDSGHGLGLSIVQAIVGAHRAELSARPLPEGGLSIDLSFPSTSGAGSRVKSWLPRRNAAAPGPL